MVNEASASNSIYVCACVHVPVSVYLCLCMWPIFIRIFIGLGGRRPNRSQKSNALCLSFE